MNPAFPLRYRDLTSAHVWGLRLCAALEVAYPQHAAASGNRSAANVLAGYEAFRLKQREAR